VPVMVDKHTRPDPPIYIWSGELVHQEVFTHMYKHERVRTARVNRKHKGRIIYHPSWHTRMIRIHSSSLEVDGLENKKKTGQPCIILLVRIVPLHDET